MFNAGEYDSDHTDKMLAFCRKSVWPGKSNSSYFGHWHYTHYYYAQVMYRLGKDDWKKYFDETSKTILQKQSADGSWREGHVGPVYTTAMNTTILQLNNAYLPIFQR